MVRKLLGPQSRQAYGQQGHGAYLTALRLQETVLDTALLNVQLIVTRLVVICGMFSSDQSVLLRSDAQAVSANTQHLPIDM